MHKPNIKAAYNAVKKSTIKHSPEILTGIGIAGMVTTTVMAVRATPKALRLIDNAEIKKANETNTPYEEPNLSKTEIIKVTWKCYIPVAITGGLSIACLIGASSVNARRNAALATAYSIAETSLKEYQNKVVETIGEKKEQTIRDAVAKEKIDAHPAKESEIIFVGDGETLCYDVLSGRYFKSKIDKIKKAENDLNRRMRDEMYISLNEFYYEIGLPSIKIGDDIGWNIDREGYIDLRYTSQLNDNDEPVFVIDYGCGPRYDYRNLM